jgi:TetR/AcrR family transcriptional repressor of nem operon
MIGNFSLELTDHSELIRNQLSDIFKEWSQTFAECIGEAQRLGELESDTDPAILADFLLNAWEGAILRMKVERSGKPLEQFQQIAFTKILI